ncbi:MAG: YihY/virulence factor BrkB family protein [Streptomycetaceae bacterium]|nr:YihY/virulence factor BrkB family protein [Streptomycetaceae bacterium]
MAIKDKLHSMRGVGHAMRAYERYTERDGNFAAAAVTFYGFFSLFPLIALAAAVVAAALSPGRVQELQDKIADNIPGIADKINLSSLADNAGAVGVIGGVVLLFSGLGWVEALRPAIRKMWFADEAKPEGVKGTVATKAKDVGVLIGLGLAMLLSVGASAFATSVIGRISDSIGLQDQPVGRVLLQIAAFAVAVFASLVLFLYLLVAMPRLEMPRRTALVGALIGAIGFEVLKVLVSSYISSVASKSMYGAFGVPIALLLWIYLATRLLLLCAAWTATDKRAEEYMAEKDAKGDRPVEWAANAAASADEQAKPPRTLRNYTLGVLGTAGAGVALERFTRRPRGGS